MDKTTRQAFEIGRVNAEEVISFRKQARQRREHTTGTTTAGVLMAEGDSWFDYPWTDILRLLEDEHGYDIESVAHYGDTVEEMAYSGGQLERFSRKLEKLLRTDRTPRAILLSGGGNDIAGTEFGMLIDHAASATAGINEQVVSGVLNQRIRLSYITILSAITEICLEWVQQPLPILIHGYDYPIPDGRGFLGGLAFLPGPWLEPGFREKGFARLQTRKMMARDLVDRFNVMLAAVASMPEFPHVNYVDLRKTLSTGANYRQFWENELHPTINGFRLVTARFVSVLDDLE